MVSPGPVIPLPAPLPPGFEQLSDVYDVAMPSATPLPAVVRIPIWETIDSALVGALHYDTASGEYEAVGVRSDAPQGYVDVVASEFSPFLLVKLIPQLAPSTFAATRSVGVFEPTLDGFEHINNGEFIEPFSPNGLCLGMANYAAWHFSHAAISEPSRLRSVFDRVDSELVAQRAFLATRPITLGYWLHAFGAERSFVDYLRLAIATSNAPHVIALAGDSGNQHAVVAYGYDDDSILIYDPNQPDGCAVTVKIDVA